MDGEIKGLIASSRDITEQEKLKAQFIQAQKMEAVGRLAGGVAHDYNNTLNVIIGFTELSMEKIDPAGPLHTDLNEVLKAAIHAADITRQLLAFARKQIVAPVALNLNDNIEMMLKMLRHLIGEDIDLAWLPGTGLWPVKMDPSQIDQILANLCVNARDAIAGVGKVTIETVNNVIDAAYCTDHVGFIPGEFVLITVSENGCGMDKETLNNIFEPFFTTKNVGKGTGLGLATVYGIVKQNKGFINVYSEPGTVTTFKIYMPRYEGKAAKIQRESTVEISSGLGDTVLVVEDDLTVLKLAKTILDELGYSVLIATTPGEALSLAEEHAGKIQLLITDVILPEMNGHDLANRLQSLCPELKCVFMSGYTRDVIDGHGVLDEGMYFLQKPFYKRDLAITVRKVLEEGII
jgi:nitrogen-specific signal transduction histidine kinase/CheY-like chemotaxis protein